MAANQGVGEYCVDIVMCIDATGSMSPFLDEVKSNALSIYQKFVDGMEEEGKDVEQLRIKVIAFRDYGVDDEPMVESEFFVLPDQNEEFKNCVQNITASGGGDEPENALEAIALALKSDWTTEGARRRHVIVVFTDASALELGARSDSPKYPDGMPSSLAELAAWWEKTDQTFGGTYERKAGRLVAFVPNATPWTDIQSWNRYWPNFSSTAGGGCSEIDIQSAVDIVVGSC